MQWAPASPILEINFGPLGKQLLDCRQIAVASRVMQISPSFAIDVCHADFTQRWLSA